MQVTATEPDREDAAAMVNAVVDAYMNEVVNYDRQQRRDRLSDLQQISAEKENEVRTKREQLKRELENIGAGDDETMKARSAVGHANVRRVPTRIPEDAFGTPHSSRQTSGGEEGLGGPARRRDPRDRGGHAPQ